MNFKYSDIYLAISTDNINLLKDFYSQLLGRQPNVYHPSVYVEFRLQKLRIAIFKPKPDRQPEFENLNSSMSLCIEVEDLVSAIALLADLGCPPPGEVIEASHGKEVYAYDPAGNRLILYQPR